MSPTNSNIIVILQERLDNLGVQMGKGFDDLKFLVAGFDQRLRTLETSDARDHPMTNTRLVESFKKLDDHESRIKFLESTSISPASLESLSETATTTNEIATRSLLISTRLESILRWLLGIISVILTGFLLALFTGKATILFK